VLNAMTYLEPWYAAEDPALVAELSREVGPGHVLSGIPVKVLARRRDRDDVLFKILDGSGRVASVHLTWQVESSPTWPSATVFRNFEEWVDSMNADHAEYGA
jgi:hypothetical protein